MPSQHDRRNQKPQTLPLSLLTALLCFAGLIACATGLGVAWTTKMSNLNHSPSKYDDTYFSYQKLRLFRLWKFSTVCDYTEYVKEDNFQRCAPQSSLEPSTPFDKEAFWNKTPARAVLGCAITTACLLALATLAAIFATVSRDMAELVDIVSGVLCFLAMLMAAATLGVFNRYFPVGGSLGPQCMAAALVCSTFGFLSSLLESFNISKEKEYKENQGQSGEARKVEATATN